MAANRTDAVAQGRIRRAGVQAELIVRRANLGPDTTEQVVKVLKKKVSAFVQFPRRFTEQAESAYPSVTGDTASAEWWNDGSVDLRFFFPDHDYEADAFPDREMMPTPVAFLIHDSLLSLRNEPATR